jgi:hypothetical protein
MREVEERSSILLTLNIQTEIEFGAFSGAKSLFHIFVGSTPVSLLSIALVNLIGEPLIKLHVVMKENFIKS